MAHINLLPWREELRKEQKKQFAILSLLTVVLAGLVLLYAHLYIGGLLDDQNARNEYLKTETAALDQRIKEIKDLETTRAKLQARINIIQQLQRSRPSVVHLFDELARTLPNGVYLSGIAQKDLGVTVTGVAQSNARVSAFMRNVEDSKWIGSPKLDVISSKTQDQHARSNDFTLLVTQVDKDKDDAADSAPGKAGAAAGKAAAKAAAPQNKQGGK
jgi:type IV pilus assembly protein PilN